MIINLPLTATLTEKYGLNFLLQLIGFPFFESQAKWIAKLLSDKTSLPSSDQMMQSIAEFYQSREANGVPKRNTHDIADFKVGISQFLSLFFFIFFQTSYVLFLINCVFAV